MNAASRRPDRTLACVALLATLARIAAFMIDTRDPILSLRAIDETSYAALAARFASGDSFFGRDTLWFAPLYPVSLGVAWKWFGPAAATIAIVLQHALGVGTALLGVLLGRRLGSRFAGAFAGVLLAVLPTLIHAEGRLLYTGPLVFATAAFLFAFEVAREEGNGRKVARSSIVAGLLLGVAGLFRANVLAFAPFAAWMLGRARGAKCAALFFATCGATLVPTLLRNGILAGEWTASTANGGMIFATGFAEDAKGGRALERTPEDFAPGGGFHREAERALGRTLTLGEASEFHARQAWRRIAEQPQWAASLVGAKALLLVNAREIDDNLGFPLARDRSPLYSWLPAPWAFVLIPAAGGIAVAAIGRDAVARRFRASAVFFVVTGATLLCYFVTSRYRLPLVVPAALLGGLGLERAGRALRFRQWADAAVLFAGMATAALIALRDPGVVADPALELVAVGAALEDRGEHRLSLQATDEAIRRSPSNAGAWHNRALALEGLGRREEALEATTQAIRLDPELAAAWLTRGAFLARDGRIEEAVEPFARALALQPENPDARDNLAQALESVGRGEEAARIRRGEAPK